MAHYTAPLTAPTPADAMQRFIETEEPLEKPLLFERADSQFKKLLCCQAAMINIMGCGMAIPFVPIASCCPGTYADQFSLKLDKDTVTFQAAANDCCWWVGWRRIGVQEEIHSATFTCAPPCMLARLLASAMACKCDG